MSVILNTIDGGINWTAQTNSTYHLFSSVSFTNSNNGYVIDYNKTVLNTTVGGVNWFMQSNTGFWLRSIFFYDSVTGYIVGDNGTILKTINGGINWNSQTSSMTNPLNSVFFKSTAIDTR